MNDNPIMQRVMMLSEMWKTESQAHKEACMFSWLGASLVEFKTIKGFTLFQTSYEKTFQDIVCCIQHPFNHEKPAEYNRSILQAIINAIEVCKENADLTLLADAPIHSVYVDADLADAQCFIDRLGQLANALHLQEESLNLIVAIYPQHITDFVSYAAWIESLLQQPIPANLKFMLYDGAEVMMFKAISENYPKNFRYLYPDLDISGAMDEILQNAKSADKTEKENDAISFQQSLIKLTEAIGYAEAKEVTFYKNSCFSYTQKHHWLHLEALVHFYLHGYYASLKELEKAMQHIDLAIVHADAANEQGVEGSREMQYQYRIAKGNCFLMHNLYDKAVASYKDCLILPQEKAHPLMLAGIYQMLGNALRRVSGKKEARQAFENGWQCLEKLEENVLKSNAMTMFYAKDMLDLADSEMYAKYALRFENWWGRNWQQQINHGQFQPFMN